MRKRPIGDIEDTATATETVTNVRQFEVIKEWRKGRVADVDVYGCDKLADCNVDEKVH